MKKTTFIFQKWFLRILCSGIVLPPILCLQILFANLIGIEDMNILYVLICLAVAMLGLTAYYTLTQRFKSFYGKGAYWVENGIVYLQKGKKTYELKNIIWINGTTVSVYGLAKAGMLVIRLEKKKIVLVSPSMQSIESFSDSFLLTIFDTILEYNQELKKDEILDFWYENKTEEKG